ncbi:MAG: L,D-transpeptidase family protein [Deltaproteobacteria bacterium]|nr:L,D-transpeptidase family protein [Deltaproteobacteria bacterium]
MLVTNASSRKGRGEAGKGIRKFVILAFLSGVLFTLSSPSFLQASVPGTKKQPPAPVVEVPTGILHMGDIQPAYAFLVDKSLQRLYIYQYQQGTEGLKLVRTFPCATGENAGGKTRLGDKRTPEGVYFFTRVIESKSLAPIYGIRAFPMDYPNLLDRREDHNGDGIWLHGTDKPLTPTSTNGCIALDNLDVVFYSKNFRSREMDWAGWRNYKARLNQQYKTIQVAIETPMILRHKDHLVVVFYQRYRSDRFVSNGTKHLYLVPEEGDLKIIGEESDPQKGGEVPPPIPPTVLAAFLTPKTAPPKPAAEPAPAPVRTAAEIKPEKAPGTVASEMPDVRTFLATWHQSWEKKDLARYMDCYSKNFRSQGKGWEQWKQQKKSLNARYRLIQVALEDVRIKKVEEQVVVSFRQVYRSDSLKSSGLKNLTLRQEGPSWKIVREDFARSKRGENSG